MHCLFFVTFDKNKAKTSEEARKYVLRHIDDEGVSIEGRGFNSQSDQFWSVIDRIYIGGRWGGLLGCEEDIVILTRGLYRRWLEPIELGLHSARGAHVSLEGENLCVYMANQKWLVVVDGHLAYPE